MKKREKKLVLMKETLRQLEEGKDLMFVEGGGEIMSCAPNSPSTVGGTKRVCC